MIAKSTTMIVKNLLNFGAIEYAVTGIIAPAKESKINRIITAFSGVIGKSESSVVVTCPMTMINLPASKIPHEAINGMITAPINLTIIFIVCPVRFPDG